MELLKPDYYDEFTCIADKCTISCCREWKINIDDETYRNWKTIQPPSEVPGHRSCLQAYTMKKDGSRIMKMTEEHDCPFLAKNRLCYLVSAYGDSMLSETCQIFPREIHEFQDHKEATMMPCCPAVLDIWKEKKRIAFPETPKEKEQPLFLVRRKVMDLIMDPEKTPEEILLESFYVLKELHRNMPLTTELVEDYFSEKTIRQLEHAINEIELPVLDTMDECNELLQDLAVNYRKEGLYRKYLEPVIELAEELSEEYEEE